MGQVEGGFAFHGFITSNLLWVHSVVSTVFIKGLDITMGEKRKPLPPYELLSFHKSWVERRLEGQLPVLRGDRWWVYCYERVGPLYARTV